jgi:hypothetical protein
VLGLYFTLAAITLSAMVAASVYRDARHARLVLIIYPYNLTFVSTFSFS